MYRPELDVLRFWGFLMVYIDHAFPVNEGAPRWLEALWSITTFAVPFFFCLSAYLITELLTAEKCVTGSVNMKAFYVRRILRIWPLYFLALGVGFFVSRLQPEWTITVLGLVSYLLFVGNWYSGKYGFLGSGIGHLWSIPVEEQFYIIWPFLTCYLTRRRLGITCALAWVISQCVLLNLCHGQAVFKPTLWTNSIVHLQYFALGAGLSLFLRGATPRIRVRWRAALIASALALLFAANLVFGLGLYDESSSITTTYPQLLILGGAMMMIMVGFLGYEALAKQRFLRYLGKISYGLYVFHLPCLMIVGTIFSRVLKSNSQLTAALIALPVTIAVASVSYRYLETPFLRMKERFEIVKSRAV